MTEPILILFDLIVTGFTIFQIWNIINSFKTGKIYNLGRKPLWSIDKNGKQHPITIVDKKEAPNEFTLATITDAIILGVTLLVWALVTAAILFPL